MSTQKKNWWLDALLFLGFLICFFLDLTGVFLHEWLGITVAVLAFVHFAFHFDWTATVLSKFFSGASMRSRWFLLIDMVIALGFVGIVFSGLIISTWLNLDLVNFTFWLDLHIITSVLTLFLVVIKVALHRKWIVCVAETHIFKPKQVKPAFMGNPVPVAKTVNRREFLKLSAILGAGTLVGVVHLHRVITDIRSAGQPAALEPVETTSSMDPLATQMEEPQAAPTAAAMVEPTSVVVTQNNAATACSVRCPRNCSFPGRCRKYVDSNGNGKCDLGECS